MDSDRDTLEQRVEQRTEQLRRLNAQLKQQIEERRQIEIDLQQSELHYRSIVEDQTEMIVRFDSEGKITFANRAYCQANGQSLLQLIGQPYYFRIHEDDRQAVMQLVDASNKESPAQASESRAYRSDGSIAYEAWTGRALYDEDGRHCGFQAVGRDVSQLHEARRKLQEKELQLTHLARVSALGEMVAGISHEINQPLATIANFCSAALLLIQQNELQADNVDGREKLKTWLTRISQQTDRINAIIQRLKRFGRPGGHAETFQIRSAIDEALMVTEVQTRQVLEKIEVIDSSHQCWVCADQIQIEQVLVNLIRNACEAMELLPADQRELKIEAKPGNRFVVITVSDSGPGISAASAADVFESFVTSKSHGMGIGLAISRSIVENHGGRIRAIPDVGYGCVEFALPAMDHLAQLGSSSPAASHPKLASQPSASNLFDRGCHNE